MFIKITSGQPVGEPLFESQFLALFRNVSFVRPIPSKDVVSRGYAFYQQSFRPDVDRYEVVEPSSPVQVSDDLWEQGWSVRQMTSDEIASVDFGQESEMRDLRDKALRESDWTQFSDSPLSETDKNSWRLYRNSLRDVPAQSGFPRNIVWPELPT